MVSAAQWPLVLLLALAYAVLSFYLNKTLGNRKRIKEIQREMNAVQKEFSEAAKTKDEKELKRLEERQKAMSGLMMESMQLQFKPLLVILPLFLILFGGFGFAGLLPMLFPGFEITLPFDMHLNAIFTLNLLQTIPVQALYGIRGYFIVCLFFAGIAIELLYSNLIEKKQNAAANNTPKPENPSQ